MKHTAVRLISTLVLSLLGVPFAAEVSPAETLREQVIGAWTLVSHPYWPDAVGRLLYTREGQMCVTIMRPDRPKFFAASPYAQTVEERVAVAAVTGTSTTAARITSTRRKVSSHTVSTSVSFRIGWGRSRSTLSVCPATSSRGAGVLGDLSSGNA
jgi:hypothetical protein